MDRDIWLVVCGSGPETGSFRIGRGCHIIGRSELSDIQLLHPSVSRRHAAIKNEHGKLLIEDLGSVNGTFADGRPVELAEIKVGSSLRLGRVMLDVLHNLASSDPSESEQDATDRAPVHDSADVHFRTNRFPPMRAQVLRLLLEGHSEKQIAARLHVTRHTIDWHVKAIYKNLGVHSRAALSAFFHAQEMIPEPIEADSPRTVLLKGA